MHDMGRRRFLAASSMAVATLAGCTQVRDVSGGDDGEETSTGSGGLRLETLDVDGSPGEPIRVEPPGEVVLLDFFATWCEPCKPQMAELRTVHENAPDLHMLSITWENERAAVREFWQEYEGTWPVALDPRVKAGSTYDVNGLPTMVVLDADGTEVWRHTGLAKAATI